jgi:hypothetical protein
MARLQCATERFVPFEQAVWGATFVEAGTVDPSLARDAERRRRASGGPTPLYLVTGEAKK